MGHFLQAEGLSEVGEIHQKLHDAPVVGLEELPEGQDGEKLGLGEVPAGKPVGVARQGSLGQLEGLPGQAHGGLRHWTARSFLSHAAASCLLRYPIFKTFSTEHAPK